MSISQGVARSDDSSPTSGSEATEPTTSRLLNAGWMVAFAGWIFPVVPMCLGWFLAYAGWSAAGVLAIGFNVFALSQLVGIVLGALAATRGDRRGGVRLVLTASVVLVVVSAFWWTFTTIIRNALAAAGAA